MNELSGKLLAMAELSTLQVFDTMVNMQGVVLSRSVEPSDIPVNGVGGCVSFAGNLSGVVYLLMSESLAQRIARTLLGCATAEPAEVKDVVGELTNMVAGGLKNQLAQEGFDSCLTIPTFIRAIDTTINVGNLNLAATNIVRLSGGEETIQVRIAARKMP